MWVRVAISRRANVNWSNWNHPFLLGLWRGAGGFASLHTDWLARTVYTAEPIKFRYYPMRSSGTPIHQCNSVFYSVPWMYVRWTSDQPAVQCANKGLSTQCARMRSGIHIWRRCAIVHKQGSTSTCLYILRGFTGVVLIGALQLHCTSLFSLRNYADWGEPR